MKDNRGKLDRDPIAEKARRERLAGKAEKVRLRAIRENERERKEALATPTAGAYRRPSTGIPGYKSLHKGKSTVQVRVRTRAIPGTWEELFLRGLRRGYTYEAAAGFAGVRVDATKKKRNRDPDFAAAVEVAYNRGTARLQDLADARMRDKYNPADRVLTHMLSSRGITSRQIIEHQGQDGGPVQIESSNPQLSFDKVIAQLPIEQREQLLIAIEKLEQKVKLEKADKGTVTNENEQKRLRETNDDVVDGEIVTSRSDRRDRSDR